MGKKKNKNKRKQLLKAQKKKELLHQQRYKSSKKRKKGFNKLIRDLNIPFLILGVLSLLAGIYAINDKTAISANALTTIDATLRSDIHFLKGRRAEYNCRLYTKEYMADFVVPKGAAPGNINGLLRNLRSGDRIQLSVMNWEQNSLKDDAEDITIYAITHNNQAIYTLTDYNNNNITGYDFRVGVFILFVGCMLLLSAFNLITLRQGFIICVAFIAIVIIIKVLK